MPRYEFYASKRLLDQNRQDDLGSYLLALWLNPLVDFLKLERDGKIVVGSAVIKPDQMSELKAQIGDAAITGVREVPDYKLRG